MRLPRPSARLGRAVAFAAVAGWCAPLPAAPPRYTGTPILQVFNDRTLVGNPQPRRLAVHPNGLVYAAHTQGLSEYDGHSWRLIPGTEGLIVHNLGIDAAGRVWYSAKNGFGRLVPDALGRLVAEPWQTKLPVDRQAVGQVLNLLVAGRDVYFVTQGARSFLAHVDATDRLRVIEAPSPTDRFVNVFASDGKIYALTAANAWRVENDRLVPAPEATALVKAGVQSVWPRAEGGAWVVSAAGLRVWRDGEAPLVSRDVGDFLADGRVLSGVPIGGGLFALGTEQRGLLFVDAGGRIVAHYDENDGLGPTGNRIESMTTDADGGLWLVRYAGITRLQARTPSALHDLNVGLHGRAETFLNHRGRFYVGTTEGLFVRDEATGRFSAAPGAGVDAWALVAAPEGMFVAGTDLRLLRDDGTVEIIEPERLLFRSALLLPKDPTRLVASTGPGQLRLYRRGADGKWAFESKVDDVRDVLFDLAQDDAGWLWGAFDNRRTVARLDWRKGVDPAAKLEVFGPEKGLPVSAQQRRNAGVFLLNGRAEVTSLNGLWRHDPAADRLVPEARIAGLDRGRWSRAYPLRDGSLFLVDLGERTPNAIARRTGPDAWRVEPLPTMGFESLEPRALFDDPVTKNLWISYASGLVSTDPAAPAEPGTPPVARVRGVGTTSGELLWGGAGEPFKAPLPPAKNSLRFAVSADAFRPDAWSNASPDFRARLVGLDDAWSDWSGNVERDYANLPPGRYSFRVQARDATGLVGPETAFDFAVLPPWWRTGWAFAGYAIAAALLVLAIVRLRTRALRARARALETEVAARTRELAAQNAELARLHKLELDEKITARLAEEKARLEVLRYQLNPHFLFNTLTSIRAAIPAASEAARAMVTRLAEFCRLTLHRPDDEDLTTLGEELALLRAYLDIEKSRWGDLLEVTIDCPAELGIARLPQFLLLPLVENALKYGRATSPERVGLRLAARRGDDADSLVLTVANTGAWIAPGASRDVVSLGIGIENLRERLARHYPGAHELTLDHADGWVTAKLQLRGISD